MTKNAARGRKAALMLVTAVSGLCVGQGAHGQESQASTDDENGQGLQEIVVTAQKREESLQETPISISVLGGEDLQNRNVVSLLDLGDGAIPSLRVAPFFSRPGALIVNIRGVGVLSDSNQPARDQGVAMYVDGVYMGRPQGLAQALFDVERIEVLKGPQGTLFGRNTEGGAVSIITRKPSGEFKLNASAGIGNFGSTDFEVHADLPEAANISFKVDGVLSRRNGFVKNPLAGNKDYNSYDKRGLHIGVLWKPSDSFSADYSFDTSYDATVPLFFQFLEAPVGAPATATAPAIAPNRVAAISTLQPRRARVASFGTPQQESIGKSKGVRLTLDWKAADALSFKSITSYRRLTQTQYDNANSAAVSQPLTTANPTGSFLNFQFGRYSLAPFKQNQFSQEVQAVGDYERLKFVVGALYYREKVEDNAQAFNTLQFTDVAGSAFVVRSIDYNAQVIQRASRVRTTSIGAFGQATYTPPIANDIFHITGGLRWTKDSKLGSLFTVNGAAPIVPINGVNVQAPVPLDKSWSRVDPLINLSLDVSEDVHVYGKWSTGYKSGGANSRSLNYAEFGPETVSMFEIGAKTEFWDNKARFNIALYKGNYKNIQLDFSGLYEDVINGVRIATTRTTTNTVNAPGTGKLKGLEAELTLAPVSGLTLSASYAYNSVKIPDTRNPFPQTGGVFITVPVPIYQVYTPKHSASGSIDYELPLNGFTLRAHLDGNYSTGYYANYTDSEFDPVTRAVRYVQPRGENALVFNGRLSVAEIEMPGSDAKLSFSIWARNLFNEQYVFYKSGAPRSGVSGFFNDPRTFGGEINIKF